MNIKDRFLVRLALVALVCVAARPAFAHFSWIVVDKGVGKIFLSETLKYDDGVDGTLVSATTLSFKDADGKARTVALKKGLLDFSVDVPSNGTVFGKLDLGLNKRGGTAHILLYFPKTVVGDPFGRDEQDTDAPVELEVGGTPDAPRLRFFADGKPQADAEINLVLPDDSQKKVKTDANGYTEPLLAGGRYGAWARHWVKESGERGGVAYTEVRRYATLVFDLKQAAASKAASTVAANFAVLSAGRLPEATSSFGAASDGDWLYVYGGHVAPTHDYSKTSVSGAFHRFNVKTRAWEKLPAGPSLQGMNVAVHRGRVIRAGGMRPENEPGMPADTRSHAEVSAFDPATKVWEALPPLPANRSSHDVAVVGDKLIVIGGWDMRGREGSVWLSDMLVLDLAKKPLEWKSLPQPFKRRAFVTAVRDGSLFVIGGFDGDDKVITEVDIYDVATNSWSKAPSLPKGPRNGFSPAAAFMDGRLYASLMDGGVYRLNEAAGEWERVATTTGRVAHRMVAAPGGALFLIGGAANGDNLDALERIDVGATARSASR